MNELQISNDFSLPLDAVTETFALLAKRGSGKTYTAKVMAEEMIGAGLPVAIIDPIGVWWGLRSSSDGLAPGLPVVVFGGDHADVPLEEHSGELLADVLIDERFPAIFDLSLLSKGASRRWMADFAERLYHRNREALHLFIDEADAFAPQRPDPGAQRLLGAVEDLVRRGRARGIGLTLITQRPAVLNKDVLTQTQTLIALRMTGVLDVKAIDEWVRLHADEDEARELKASLPSLPVGTAWVWAPDRENSLQKIQVRLARTFDSSATPKVGETRIEPRQLAQIDLASLGERIAAQIERAQEEDPAALKKQVGELRKQLAQNSPKIEVREKEVPVEVPVLADGELERLETLGHDLHDLGKAILARLAGLKCEPEPKPQPAPVVVATTPVPSAPKAAPAKKPTSNGRTDVTPAQHRILDALASFEATGLRTVARSNVAVWAGQSASSGSYEANVRALKKFGLLDYPEPGQLTLTDDGRAVATQPDAPLSLTELHSAWMSRFSRAQASILEACLKIYPASIARVELAAKVNQSPGSGSYEANVRALRNSGLLDYPRTGEVVATNLLFPDALK